MKEQAAWVGGGSLRKRKHSIFLIGAFIICIVFYFVFIRDKYPIVEELPEAMQKQFNIVYHEDMNRVSLERNGANERIGITIDEDKTLYIANPVGNNITDINIDKNKKEIYLFKSEFSYHEGDNDKFQLITVPYTKYEEVIINNTLTVYIDYGPGNELRKYNVTNGEYELLEYNYPVK